MASMIPPWQTWFVDPAATASHPNPSHLILCPSIAANHHTDNIDRNVAEASPASPSPTDPQA